MEKQLELRRQASIVDYFLTSITAVAQTGEKIIQIQNGEN
jgi:hypothetical protein